MLRHLKKQFLPAGAGVLIPVRPGIEGWNGPGINRREARMTYCPAQKGSHGRAAGWRRVQLLFEKTCCKQNEDPSPGEGEV